VGIGAHALDERNGHPLRTEIPDRVLLALGAVSIAAAAAIGLYGVATVDPWIGAFVAAGVFVVLAYNLELAGGRFHSDLWFAVAWGSFPLVTAYFAQAGTVRASTVLGALFAGAFSFAQRRLSTQVRDVRRRVRAVDGTIERLDGSREPLTRESLIEPAERALRSLMLAAVALAVTLVAMRLA
jgi:hypothetical protein